MLDVTALDLSARRCPSLLGSLVAVDVRVVVGGLITDSADGSLSNLKVRGAATEVGIRDLLGLGGVTGVDLIVAASRPKKGEECGASGGRIFSMWIKGHLFPFGWGGELSSRVGGRVLRPRRRTQGSERQRPAQSDQVELSAPDESVGSRPDACAVCT